MRTDSRAAVPPQRFATSPAPAVMRGWIVRRGSGRHGVMAAEVARYWRHAAVDGVDLLRARYVTHRYGRHAHETYTFGLIEAGVEEFEYGGSLLRASGGRRRAAEPRHRAHRPGRDTGRLELPRAVPEGQRRHRCRRRARLAGWHAAIPADGAARRRDGRAAAQRAPGCRAWRRARVVDAAAHRAGRACCARTRPPAPARSRSGAPDTRRRPRRPGPAARTARRSRRPSPSWPR